MQFIYTMKGLGKVHPPDHVVLKDIWLSFLPGAKIGVLGLNGSGKSSLLRIMSGQDRQFVGEAWPAEGISIGFLEQEPKLDPAKTVLGNVEEGVSEVKALLARYDEINAMFGEDMPAEKMDKILEEQGRVQDRIEAADGWNLDSRLELAMDALRLPPPDADVAAVTCRFALRKFATLPALSGNRARVGPVWLFKFGSASQNPSSMSATEGLFAPPPDHKLFQFKNERND